MSERDQTHQSVFEQKRRPYFPDTRVNKQNTLSPAADRDRERGIESGRRTTPRLTCYQTDWIMRGPELDDGAQNAPAVKQLVASCGTIRDNRQKPCKRGVRRYLPRHPYFGHLPTTRISDQY